METIEKLLHKNMTSIEEQIFIREWIVVTSNIRRHYLKHGGYVFRNRNIRTNPRKSEKIRTNPSNSEIFRVNQIRIGAYE